MAKGGLEVQLYSFFNLSTRQGWVVNPCPGTFTPRKKDRVPTVQEAVWAPAPGFDPWTIKPIASHYTDYASDDIQKLYNPY